MQLPDVNFEVRTLSWKLSRSFKECGNLRRKLIDRESKVYYHKLRDCCIGVPGKRNDKTERKAEAGAFEALVQNRDVRGQGF